jgi:hypothetical protein
LNSVLQLARLTKKCLIENYSTVCIDEILPHTFPILIGLKQGAASSPLLFNFALEYAIKMAQGNRPELKLNGTHEIEV